MAVVWRYHRKRMEAKTRFILLETQVGSWNDLFRYFLQCVSRYKVYIYKYMYIYSGLDSSSCRRFTKFSLSSSFASLGFRETDIRDRSCDIPYCRYHWSVGPCARRNGTWMWLRLSWKWSFLCNRWLQILIQMRICNNAYHAYVYKLMLQVHDKSMKIDDIIILYISYLKVCVD